MDTNIVNNTPVSEYLLQVGSDYGININDTDTTHSFYDISSVTVSGKTLTFTNKSDTLTITFPASNPNTNTNTMSINVILSQNEPTSLSLNVTGSTNVSNTFNIFSKFVVSSAAQYITGFVPVNFIVYSGGYINFIMDTSIVTNIPLYEYSSKPAYANQISIDNSNTSAFYDMSSVVVSGNKLTFINGSDELQVWFPNNFA